jgi:uncharacterized protein YxeA
MDSYSIFIIILLAIIILYLLTKKNTSTASKSETKEKQINKVRRDAAEERKVQNYRENLFTTEVTGKSRRFFFDVRESLDGRKFLSISELEKEIGGDKAYTVLIFGDEIEGFKKAFERSYGFMKSSA